MNDSIARFGFQMKFALKRYSLTHKQTFNCRCSVDYHMRIGTFSSLQIDSRKMGHRPTGLCFCQRKNGSSCLLFPLWISSFASLTCWRTIFIHECRVLFAFSHNSVMHAEFVLISTGPQNFCFELRLFLQVHLSFHYPFQHIFPGRGIWSNLNLPMMPCDTTFTGFSAVD